MVDVKLRHLFSWQSVPESQSLDWNEQMMSTLNSSIPSWTPMGTWIRSLSFLCTSSLSYSHASAGLEGCDPLPLIILAKCLPWFILQSDTGSYWICFLSGEIGFHFPEFYASVIIHYVALEDQFLSLTKTPLRFMHNIGQINSLFLELTLLEYTR